MTKANDLEARGIDLNAVFKEAVDRSGLSRHAIAKELDVNRSSITRPYNREKVPSLELLSRVAELAGLEVTIRLKKQRRSKD